MVGLGYRKIRPQGKTLKLFELNRLSIFSFSIMAYIIPVYHFAVAREPETLNTFGSSGKVLIFKI
jgi:hypothetical protein